LHRALALAQCDHVPLSVAEQLDLDVPWTLDEALAEDAVVPKGGLRLPPSRPTQMIPAASTASAKSGFSARNPYPG
jgi:hypothetical protein